MVLFWRLSRGSLDCCLVSPREGVVITLSLVKLQTMLLPLSFQSFKGRAPLENNQHLGTTNWPAFNLKATNRPTFRDQEPACRDADR